jgi:hypothetical protein
MSGIRRVHTEESRATSVLAWLRSASRHFKEAVPDGLPLHPRVRDAEQQSLQNRLNQDFD